MTNFHNRRRFLQLTGVSATAAVAGCSSLNPMSSDDPHADYVTVFAGPPAAEQLELQAAIEEGEMDMQEAQQEFAQLAEDAIPNFEQAVEETDGLSIVENHEQAFLVDGSPEALVDELKHGYVESLSPGVVYSTVVEQMEQQQQQQEQLPEELPEEGEAPEEDPEADEEDGTEDQEGDDGTEDDE